MRTTTFSSLALLATSLLVKEVFAGRYDVRKRDLIFQTVTDEVIVTEEITVTLEADGSLQTGTPHAVGTTTIAGPVGNQIPLQSAPVAAASPTDPYAAGPSVVATSVPSVESPSDPYAAPPSVVAPTSSLAVGTPADPYAAPPTVVVTPTPATPSAVAAPVVESSTSSDGGIFIQKPSTSAYAALTTTPVVVAAPTTLATVVSSASVPASSPASGSGGKRGLAYNDASILSGFFSSQKISWAYNWASSSSGLASGIEYVPMLWGLGSDKTSTWNSDANKAIASGTTHLMSFNEPDLGAQSNIGYADAATGFMTYMQPFAGKAKLGSPAVTNGGAPMGLTYLENFLQSCSSCTIDFVAIHWYDSAENIGYFQNYIQDAYKAGGNRPLWITEFGASGSADQQNTFLETVLPWLDSQDYVERYSYFMASDGILLSGGSTLSTLGNTYATL